MSRSHTIFAATALLCLPLLAPAQLGNRAVVNVDAVPTLTARRGTTVLQTLNVSVDPGYHVNSNKPKDEFLIPLKLTWAGPLQVRSIEYPAAEQVKVGNDTLDVFTGKFLIKTNFDVPAQASPGITTVEGKLHYQACDNQSCKRPATVNVQIPVSIQ